MKGTVTTARPKPASRRMEASVAAAEARLREVPLGSRSLDLLRSELGDPAWGALKAAREEARSLLAGRTVWLVNSTARGGGIAEMIRTLIPYWRGERIDARWLVVEGPPEYERWGRHAFLIDVAAGAAGGFSLEGLEDVHFVTRTPAGDSAPAGGAPTSSASTAGTVSR